MVGWLAGGGAASSTGWWVVERLHITGLAPAEAGSQVREGGRVVGQDGQRVAKEICTEKKFGLTVQAENFSVTMYKLN